MKIEDSKMFVNFMAGYAKLHPEERKKKLHPDGSKKLTVGIGPIQKTIVRFDTDTEEQEFIQSVIDLPVVKSRK